MNQEIQTIITSVSQIEEVKSKLMIAEKMSFERLIEMDEGFDSSTIKELYETAIPELHSIYLILYMTSKGEQRHVAAMTSKTKDTEEIKKKLKYILNQLQIDIKFHD